MVSTGPQGYAEFLMDIFLNEQSIEEAFYIGMDLAEEAIDRLSFLSYAPAWGNTISITQPVLAVGEECLVGILYGAFQRSRVVVSEERFRQLDQIELDCSTSAALRAFRTGISDHNPYRSFAEFWKAVEPLAEAEAKAKGYEYEVRCPSCNGIVTMHPATQRAVRDLLIDLGPDYAMSPESAKKRADEARKFRGAIFHGARLSDHRRRAEAEDHVRLFQPASAIAISKHAGVRPMVRESTIQGMPFLVLRFRRTGPGAQDFQSVEPFYEWKQRVARSALPEAFADASSFKASWGVQEPVNIDPRAFPDLAQTESISISERSSGTGGL